MEDIEKKTKDEVKNLGEQLKKMAFNMRVFSLTMRSLYVDSAVGTNDALANKFRKLRDDTKNDAMVYLKGILPVSTKFVSSISEYFEFYEVLNYEDWCDVLRDILEETTGYKQLCITLLKMHEEILVPLKKRQNEAQILVMEFEELKIKYEEQKKVLEAKAQSKSLWASFLCWIPGVGQIASPLLRAAANLDLAEAVANTKQTAIFGSASITVKESLIPALEHFIDAIKKAAGFFSVMEYELKTFESKADKALEKRKMLYYKVMNTEARDIKSICQIFYAVLPDVRTDFLAIPCSGTDQNYVDRWLAKEKNMIQQNFATDPKLIQILVKSIAS